MKDNINVKLQTDGGAVVEIDDETIYYTPEEVAAMEADAMQLVVGRTTRWATVMTHRDIAIQALVGEVLPDECGYRAAHPALEGQRFDSLLGATGAIDALDGMRHKAKTAFA